MSNKKAGVIVIAGLIGTAACVRPGEKHDEPKEARDATATLRSETAYTMNVSYGVSTNIIKTFGLEIPEKK